MFVVNSFLLLFVASVGASAAYFPFPNHYCAGAYPGPPDFSGNFTVAECQAKCDEAECLCFDHNITNTGYNCRGTSSTKSVHTSGANYNAFVRVGPSTAVQFKADISQQGKPFKHFWESCGWCPPDPHPQFASYFLTEDQVQNHAYIGSVPQKGIKYVRIHYLLDLVDVLHNTSQVVTESDPSLTYFTEGYLKGVALNWTNLELGMDIVVSNGMFPGFEIMGNPGGSLFTDFTDKDQIFAWKDMVAAMVTQMITRYGVTNVRQWRFESWNEPDGQCKKDLTVGIKCDLPSFLNYFDASNAGLREVDKDLIFGGPASDGDKDFLIALVAHCVNGTNFITGGSGCGPVSYFNLHDKGDASTQLITDEELPFAKQVHDSLAGTPYAKASWGNDEADPLVGWNRIEEWRADTRYAAMVPKVILQHQVSFIDAGIPYDVLSNDNGFLNYPDNSVSLFTQRTLVARFAMNTTNTIETIRKPVLNVMALLALLGDTIYPITGTGSAATAEVNGFVTTKGDGEVSVLVYNSADSAPSHHGSSSNISISLVGLGPSFQQTKSIEARVLQLDDTKGSAYRNWTSMGSPKYPTPQQFAELRTSMEIPMSRPFSDPIVPPVRSINYTARVSLPGILLFHLCADISGTAPDAPTNPRVHVTTTRSPMEVMVMFDGPSQRCLQTYEIMYKSSSGNGAYTRINKMDTIFTTYLHAFDPQDELAVDGAGGCYQITAVDYWGRSSPPSASFCFTA